MNYTQKELDELKFSELVDVYVDQNKMHCMEGSSANKKFEGFCVALGYDSSFTNPINQFFDDNPGAYHALIDWVKENYDNNDEARNQIMQDIMVDEDRQEAEDDLENAETNLENDQADADTDGIEKDIINKIAFKKDSNNSWTQICIWPGTLIDGKIKEFEEMFLKEFKARVKYLEEVKTNPDPGDTTGETGGRNDVFFAIHDEDVGKFAVPRLMVGIRWLEDVIKYNDNAYLYPKEILKKYKPMW